MLVKILPESKELYGQAFLKRRGTLMTIKFQVADNSGHYHQAESDPVFCIPRTLCSRFKYPGEDKEKISELTSQVCCLKIVLPPMFTLPVRTYKGML